MAYLNKTRDRKVIDSGSLTLGPIETNLAVVGGRPVQDNPVVNVTNVINGNLIVSPNSALSLNAVTGMLPRDAVMDILDAIKRIPGWDTSTELTDVKASLTTNMSSASDDVAITRRMMKELGNMKSEMTRLTQEMEQLRCEASMLVKTVSSDNYDTIPNSKMIENVIAEIPEAKEILDQAMERVPEILGMGSSVSTSYEGLDTTSTLASQKAICDVPAMNEQLEEAVADLALTMGEDTLLTPLEDLSYIKTSLENTIGEDGKTENLLEGLDYSKSLMDQDWAAETPSSLRSEGIMLVYHGNIEQIMLRKDANELKFVGIYSRKVRTAAEMRGFLSVLKGAWKGVKKLTNRHPNLTNGLLAMGAEKLGNIIHKKTGIDTSGILDIAANGLGGLLTSRAAMYNISRAETPGAEMKAISAQILFNHFPNMLKYVKASILQPTYSVHQAKINLNKLVTLDNTAHPDRMRRLRQFRMKQ